MTAVALAIGIGGVLVLVGGLALLVGSSLADQRERRSTDDWEVP